MPNKAQDDDRVMSLVDLALAQAAGRRESFLRSACGDDPELFQQAWTYVQWEERMNGFLLDPLFPAPEPEQRFEPDDLLDGRFRIVREVGQGGMGVVYEAMDERLQRRIALKCAKAGFRRRLPPEVRNAREIAHPNVCKIFEIHTASTERGECDFITMEYLEGATLAERLRGGPPPEAGEIASQLCAGLAEAHRNGVVHGDLKSNNVILATDAGGGVRAVITDFGLARTPGASQAGMQSEVGGNPDYMAPELWKGEKPSVASDVYALGVMLCELFTGQRPFPPEMPVEERLTRKPPGLHTKHSRVVARCLDPDPARRYTSVGDVATGLGPSRARRWVLAAAAGVLVAVTGVVTYRQATAPVESLSLAILPFTASPDTAALSEGLLLNTGEHLRRLEGGRRRLTLIPVGDAIDNRVDSPAKARSTLGAAFTLDGEVRREGSRVLVTAFLTDTRLMARLQEWRTEYDLDQVGNLPVALAGMVTRTLRLPPLAVAATVNAAAYPDYATGVGLSRRNSEIDRAMPYLERAVFADPGSPLTHAKLAEVQFIKYGLSKDPLWYRRALESLQSAEQRNPDVAAVRYVSGIIHGSFGRYEESAADLLRALELEPGYGDARRRLANIYEASDRPNQALAEYRRAIEVQPDYFKNYQDLGAFYFSRGEYEESIRQYQRMVELAPELSESHYALATPYLNLGRYSDAEYELNLANGYRETANAVVGLGLVRMYQGRDAEAVPYFQRALGLGRPTSLSYINLGTAYRRSGHPKESREAYQKGAELANAALSANPRDSYQRACLAYLSARLGDRQRAESEAAQAFQSSPSSLSVRWMLVLTYEALGQTSRSISLIQDVPATILDRLNRFPDLAVLREDPRFRDLLKSRYPK